MYWLVHAQTTINVLSDITADILHHLVWNWYHHLRYKKWSLKRQSWLCNLLVIFFMCINWWRKKCFHFKFYHLVYFCHISSWLCAMQYRPWTLYKCSSYILDLSSYLTLDFILKGIYESSHSLFESAFVWTKSLLTTSDLLYSSYSYERICILTLDPVWLIFCLSVIIH